MDCSKNLTKEEVQKVRQKIRQEQIIQLVMRQTDYNREKVLEKIEKWNGNYLFVIKEYMNPNFNPIKKKVKKISTNNQKVFGEIRSFMDNANSQYKRRKAIEENRKELYNRYISQKRKEIKEQSVSNLKPISENTIIREDNIKSGNVEVINV
jgi:hypothetical protein